MQVHILTSVHLDYICFYLVKKIHLIFHVLSTFRRFMFLIVIWLDDVDCNGTEESLNQCSHADWNVTDCTHMEDTAVLCYNGTAGEHKISILNTE